MDRSRILRVRIRRTAPSTAKSSFGFCDRFDRCTKFVFCLAAIVALSGIIALLVALVPAPPPPERSCADGECASGGVEREDYSSESVRDRTTWSSDGRRLAEADVVLESSPIGLCGVDVSACRERLC